MGQILNPPGAPTYTYATWNPADAGTGVTCDTTSLYAENLTGSLRIIRATMSLSAGTAYWEQTRSGRVDGVADALANLNNYLGSDVHGWGIFTDGTLRGTNQNPGWVVAPVPAYYIGAFPTILGFGLDMNAGTLEIWVNNVSRGIAFTGLAGAIFPASGVDVAGIRGCFGNAPLQNPHPGYTTGLYT